MCTIFYSRDDVQRVEYRVRETLEKKTRVMGQGDGQEGVTKAVSDNRLASFRRLVDYCESTTTCRHEMIAIYFGEKGTAARCALTCDFCKDAKDLAKRKGDELEKGESLTQ